MFSIRKQLNDFTNNLPMLTAKIEAFGSLILFLLCTFSAALDPKGEDELVEALMLESLRNNLIQACDNERIVLHCPRNTEILIQNVFYGRLVPSADLCPPSSFISAKRFHSDELDSQSQIDKIDGLFSTTTTTSSEPFLNEDLSCDFAGALKRVSELCREKRKCRINVHPDFFNEPDPCPTTSKYLQISYKCKPTNFEDQNFCEGTNTQLSCRNNKRLSIYSAQYGRTVSGQASRCTTKFYEPDTENCINDVHAQILTQCHAQSECSIAVNDQFLGNPCPNDSDDREVPPKQLSLIYTCVNDDVFGDAALQGKLESMQELENYVKDLRIRRHNETTAIKIQNKLRNQVMVGEESSSETSETPADLSHYSNNGAESGIKTQDTRDLTLNRGEPEAGRIKLFIEDVLQFYQHLDNKERTHLYLLLALSGIIILVLLISIFYQCRVRLHEKKRRRRISALQVAKLYRQPALPCLQSSTKSTELNSLVGAFVESAGSSGSSGSGSTNSTSPMYIDSDSHPHPQAVEKRFGDALANNDFYYNQCPESHFRHSHINLTGSIRGTPMMLGSRAAAQNTLSRTATISRRPFPHQTNYVRFSHAHTPPRAPSNLHFFS